MRLLVLGGTEFAGRALVETALRRGDDVTVFNRGTHQPPPGVTALRGDRLTDLTALRTGTWDVVADTWSWAPSAVRDSAELLKDRAGRYVYISSSSVYTYPSAPGSTEDAPVIDGDPAGGDADYAPMKRGAELAVVRAFGDRAVLARAGLIIGPYENIGRLPYWLTRIARGGHVLAPGPASLGLQYIDVRDLAEWCLDTTAGGAYSVIGPPGFATMGELLETCVSVTGSAAVLRWVPAEPLLAAGVQPWLDLPIWAPPGELYDSVYGFDTRKAAVRCRPLAETVGDTWTWLQELGGVAPQRADRPRVGLDAEVEARLLEELAV
ncbi:NAD-dependent epimerase/dehydratase family protein [Nonomuraea soli]|uniref:Nucleoside-diphosphate-sugar epimerase n=1 Tax=Nonomuraea soli TaxID=1032476 RepID=A0A7W0CUR0_9ACTN|nr:NAD-dependent epimerase/dehydratase family protein [Nonomuraea soli]MBA2897509.1 nucleoside-diphosphate-sugar epimerase [Nonomuraea soli]